MPRTRKLKDFQNPPADEAGNGAGPEIESGLTIEDGGCLGCHHAAVDHLGDEGCSVDGCECEKFEYPEGYNPEHGGYVEPDGQSRLPSEEFEPTEAEKAAIGICGEWQGLVAQRMELSAQEKTKKDQLFTFMQNSSLTAFQWNGKTCRISVETVEKLVIE